jgi:hypothetical protein
MWEAYAAMHRNYGSALQIALRHENGRYAHAPTGKIASAILRTSVFPRLITIIIAVSTMQHG